MLNKSLSINTNSKEILLTNIDMLLEMKKKNLTHSKNPSESKFNLNFN